MSRTVFCLYAISQNNTKSIHIHWNEASGYLNWEPRLTWIKRLSTLDAYNEIMTIYHNFQSKQYQILIVEVKIQPSVK